MSSSHAYKGKLTNRSWTQLPPALVLMISTQLLWLIESTSTTPARYVRQDTYHQRRMFAALRSARLLEVMMQVCPSWGHALEVHSFWIYAYKLLDPGHALDPHQYARIVHHSESGASLAARPLPSPYRHFRTISSTSCMVCRFAMPGTNVGLLTGKKLANTTETGCIHLCKDHRDSGFCGACMYGDMPPYTSYRVVPNEDEASFPGVESTCDCCRKERLFASMEHSESNLRLIMKDRHCHALIETYVTEGEETVERVLSFVNERLWLILNTRITDMASQALAASKYAHMEADADIDMDFSDSEEEEEDYELYDVSESAMRSTALDDWARNRLLSGYWVSPADIYYEHKSPSGQDLTVAAATHPCPWTLGDKEATHPERPVETTDVPASFKLCEQAFYAHSRVIRTLLFAPMQNIVRRLVIECAADGVDVGIRAGKMTMEDVLHFLKDSTTWFDGIDWIERRRNNRRAPSDREHSDDSASSEESNGTSPAASTTTMQTTPSPTPSSPKSSSKPITIPIAPVLVPPKPLHAVPYIPETLSNLPHYSMDALKSVWREACAPLYHCRCSICERAAQSQQAATALTITVPAGVPDARKLDEAIQLDDLDFPDEPVAKEGDEEEEVAGLRQVYIGGRWQYVFEVEEDEEEEETMTDELEDDELEEFNEVVKTTITSKETVVDDDDGDSLMSYEEVGTTPPRTTALPSSTRTSSAPPTPPLAAPTTPPFVPGTPPKRAREVYELSPARKRNSEEVEGKEEGPDEKKIRLSPSPFVE